MQKKYLIHYLPATGLIKQVNINVVTGTITQYPYNFNSCFFQVNVA